MQTIKLVITLCFVSLLWLIVFDMVRVCVRYLMGKPVPVLTEVPHSFTRLAEEWVRD